MTQKQFIVTLRKSISGLPEAEKRGILSDYEEHFTIGLQKGKSEEEIAQALGNPKTIGKAIRIDGLLQDKEEGYSVATVFRVLLAGLSLGLFNIIIVIGPYLGLVAVVISLWAVALSLGLSGVAVILALILQPIFPAAFSFAGLNIAFLIFASIGVSALGLLSLIGMWQLSRWFLDMSVKYVRFNLHIIKK
jgi:uncharacterized membrane protein